jgi:hypothetical protein
MIIPCAQSGAFLDTALATHVRYCPMTGELTDLDRTVIEALSARYARGGEAAFDEAVLRLVIAVCAVLAHTRGTAALARSD